MPSTLSNPNFSNPVLEKNNTFTLPWKNFIQDVFKRLSGNSSITLGGIANYNTTSTSNTGSGEDDLLTYTLPKDTLKKVGDIVEIEVFGTLAANGNNKNIKLYFGSQVIFTTGAVASNGKNWNIKATIVVISSTAQRIGSCFSGDTVLVTQTADYVAGSQDISAAIDIKCTGEATTTDDITQKGLIIKIYPAI